MRKAGINSGYGTDNIAEGWPLVISQVQEVVCSYWNFQDTMTNQDGIVYKGGQVIIPLRMRPEILQLLHSIHQGVQSTLRRTRDVVYWPGMSKYIELTVSQCPV